MSEYYKKQPSCKTPDGKEWFASGGGTQTTVSELKPCRCGGEAELKSKYLWASGGWGKSYTSYHAECTKCGLTGEYFNSIDHVNDRQQAIDAWNRRVGEGEKG